jgi:hypothetical protein
MGGSCKGACLMITYSAAYLLSDKKVKKKLSNQQIKKFTCWLFQSRTLQKGSKSKIKDERIA